MKDKIDANAPLCECGCGEKVTKATRYCDKGKWNIYANGHNSRSKKWRETKEQRLAEERPLCACGCGELVIRNINTLKWNKYVKSHGTKGKKLNRHMTEDLKLAIQNLIKRNKEKIWTDEERKKISDKLKDRKLPEETKRKMSVSKLGVSKSEETKIKMSVCKIKCRTGDKGYCDQWYDFDYRNDLRKGACERCGITSMLQFKLFGVSFTGHHVDFDKMNCHPSNIQTVCSRCHRIIHAKHNRELKEK